MSNTGCFRSHWLEYGWGRFRFTLTHLLFAYRCLDIYWSLRRQRGAAIQLLYRFHPWNEWYEVCVELVWGCCSFIFLSIIVLIIIIVIIITRGMLPLVNVIIIQVSHNPFHDMPQECPVFATTNISAIYIIYPTIWNSCNQLPRAENFLTSLPK